MNRKEFAYPVRAAIFYYFIIFLALLFLTTPLYASASTTTNNSTSLNAECDISIDGEVKVVDSNNNNNNNQTYCPSLQTLLPTYFEVYKYLVITMYALSITYFLVIVIILVRAEQINQPFRPLYITTLFIFLSSKLFLNIVDPLHSSSILPLYIYSLLSISSESLLLLLLSILYFLFRDALLLSPIITDRQYNQIVASKIPLLLIFVFFFFALFLSLIVPYNSITSLSFNVYSIVYIALFIVFLFSQFYYLSVQDRKLLTRIQDQQFTGTDASTVRTSMSIDPTLDIWRKSSISARTPSPSAQPEFGRSSSSPDTFDRSSLINTSQFHLTHNRAAQSSIEPSITQVKTVPIAIAHTDRLYVYPLLLSHTLMSLSLIAIIITYVYFDTILLTAQQVITIHLIRHLIFALWSNLFLYTITPSIAARVAADIKREKKSDEANRLEGEKERDFGPSLNARRAKKRNKSLIDSVVIVTEASSIPSSSPLAGSTHSKPLTSSHLHPGAFGSLLVGENDGEESRNNSLLSSTHYTSQILGHPHLSHMIPPRSSLSLSTDQQVVQPLDLLEPPPPIMDEVLMNPNRRYLVFDSSPANQTHSGDGTSLNTQGVFHLSSHTNQVMYSPTESSSPTSFLTPPPRISSAVHSAHGTRSDSFGDMINAPYPSSLTSSPLRLPVRLPHSLPTSHRGSVVTSVPRLDNIRGADDRPNSNTNEIGSQLSSARKKRQQRIFTPRQTEL